MLAWLASDDADYVRGVMCHTMKLGVVGLLPPWEQIDAEAARRVRAAGYRGVSIFFSKPLEADAAAVRRLKGALDEADLEAAQANGWYEVLVHPDEATRAEGIRGLQALARIGRVLDARNGLRPAGLAERDGRLVSAPRQLCAGGV